MSTLLKLSGIALSALLALPAAAAQRTFVASTGLDTNACTLAAPCRSFTRAMTQTDPNGEVIVLDSAGYGVVTITQSVSLIALDGVYAGISVFPGQHGIVVNGAGIKVTLRGLTVNGQGGDDGIRILSAGDVFIERVTVANTGNDPFDSGIRVAFSATGARVFVRDSGVRGTAGLGISIEANATVQVDRSRIERNGQNGIRGNAPGARLTVSNTLVARNQAAGILVNSSAAGTLAVTVARSTLDGNQDSGVLVGGGTPGANATYRVAVTDSVVQGSGNGLSLVTQMGETATALVGDNRIAGNSFTGIRCDGAGATIVAERNEVVGNERAFVLLNDCTVESLGNNAARGNAVIDAGTITTVPLR